MPRPDKEPGAYCLFIVVQPLSRQAAAVCVPRHHIEMPHPYDLGRAEGIGSLHLAGLPGKGRKFAGVLHHGRQGSAGHPP